MDLLTGPLRGRLRAWTWALGGEELRARLATLTPPGNEYGVDPFGFDLDYAIAAIAPLLWLYKKYFRVELHGVERVPPEGRVILIANHSGQLPFDAAMIGLSLLVERDPPRVLRALVEKWVPTLPFFSTAMARLGQVVGTPDNWKYRRAAALIRLISGSPTHRITPTDGWAWAGTSRSRASRWIRDGACPCTILIRRPRAISSPDRPWPPCSSSSTIPQPRVNPTAGSTSGWRETFSRSSGRETAHQTTPGK